MSEAFSVRIKRNGKWSSWSIPDIERIEIQIDGDVGIDIGCLGNGQYNLYEIKGPKGSAPYDRTGKNRALITVGGDGEEDD